MGPPPPRGPSVHVDNVDRHRRRGGGVLLAAAEPGPASGMRNEKGNHGTYGTSSVVGGVK